MTVLAKEVAIAVAGREGRATSPDGKIDVQISPPGSGGPGTNPEQLFAACYAACFGGAVAVASKLCEHPVKGSDIKVTATITLNKGEDKYFVGATLNTDLAGVPQAKATEIVAKAHTVCPYSHATRGNVEVTLLANGEAV